MSRLKNVMSVTNCEKQRDAIVLLSFIVLNAALYQRPKGAQQKCA